MLRKIIFTITLCAASMLFAQQATVSLTVKNDENENLSSVYVEAYNSNNIFLKSGVTNDKGSIELTEIPQGKIKLIISEAGYIDHIKEYDVNQDNFSLGTISLIPQKGNIEKTVLKEVVFRAETSTYRTEIDKRVVDVGKDLVSAGANASDVLNNIPSLSVDGQSGSLSLRGNENVKVFVDGKPSNIPTSQLLKQLPSNSIAKVEIITNASAKYDPDGNSGIVNIVTIKSKREGYNVGLDLGMTKGERLRNNGSINGNYNIGKMNFFGLYSYNVGNSLMKGIMKNYTLGNTQDFELLNNNQNQYFKAGFDWFINDKTALTLYTNQNFNYSPSDFNSFYTYTSNPSLLEQNISSGTNKGHNQDYSLNFKKDFKKEEHNIELDALYSFYNGDGKVNYTNQTPSFNTFYQDNVGENTNLRINLNYVNKIEKFGKIESGLQLRSEGTYGEFLTDEISLGNPVADKTYDFQRDIYSAYLNYNNKFNKLGVQLGLRAENVQENADYYLFSTTNQYEKIQNEYTELYPSAFFTYDITDKLTTSINYSRRVDRPSPGQLSPIREWSTPTITSIGNPDLKPQFTNSYELGAIQKLKKGSLSLTGFYRKLNDQIFRYVEVDPLNPNHQLLQYTNYDDTQGFGFEANFQYRPYTFWNFNLSTDLFSSTIKDNNFNDVKSNPWNMRFNQNFKISNALSIQHFTMYRGEFQFIQGKMKPMWRMDIGARYSFLEGKANLTARFSDIFKTFYAQAAMNNPYETTGEFRWEAQTLYVGLSYNFGGKVQTRADKHNNTGQQNSGGGIGF